jgi:hypothetical protein
MRDAKGKSKAVRVRVHFTAEEIAAAKAQLRQCGIGSFSDYVRWVLRRALAPSYHQWYGNIEPINDGENIPKTLKDTFPAA